jgi:lipid-binding SYLF domain-containing protein
MDRRSFLDRSLALGLGSTFVLAGCTTTPPGTAPENRAARRTEIDAGADATLQRLYSAAPTARETIGRARGVLVFPRVIEGGFFVGGEAGDGVLRVAGRPAGYYRLAAGSLGWQIGAQSKAVVIVFNTQEALDKFMASKGWAAGADASVAVAKIGANAEIDTMTAQRPVVGYALTNAGLYAGATIDGSKITRIEL